MTIPSSRHSRQAALAGFTASGTPTDLIEEPPTFTDSQQPTRKKIARAFKISLIISGGVVGAFIVAAIGLYFATSGQYPVAATVVDDASLPQIEINGVRLHAETYGDPSNPVIIVLHGGPGGDYRSQLGARSLADTNFVVFYDQRGAGLSERVPATPSARNNGLQTRSWH